MDIADAATVTDTAAAAADYLFMLNAAAIAANTANPPPAPQVPVGRKLPVSLLNALIQQAAAAAVSRTRRLTVPPGGLALTASDLPRQVLNPNGNDVPIALPLVPSADQYFRLKHPGGTGTLIVTDGSGVPLPDVRILNGHFADFVFNAGTSAWEVDG